ncbi:MAG: ROK family protein [Lachnospiraceae bacterium]|nr:ROK family protein [Lachnospiraceae bacterium]
MAGNLIKDENLKVLRRVLRKEREATKPQLAEKTGLSVVTIQSLIKTLVENGEVLEGEMVQPRLGRPAITYRFHERARLALIIFMYEKNGNDTAVCEVCDLYGISIERMEKKLKDISEESYDDMIEEMLGKYPEIMIIALGLPVVERDGMIFASDYPRLLNVNLADYLTEKFHRRVLIENDVNAAVFGYAMQEDKKRANQQNTDRERVEKERMVQEHADEELTESERVNNGHTGCIAGIYMPSKYPPGAGICLDGKVQRGRNGLAGEIRLLPSSIDWEHFTYEKESVEEYLLQTMKAFFCFYNPDKLVLYSEIVDESLFGKLEQMCENRIEKLLIPEMEIKKDLKEDFEAGMIQIALREIL